MVNRVNKEQTIIWNSIAMAMFLKKETLPKVGTFNCPRCFILNYFNREDFISLCQNGNETHYEFK